MEDKAMVAVIGNGYVGKSVVAFLKDHYNVAVFDPIQSFVLEAGGDPIGTPLAEGEAQKLINEKCKYAVVCVPTPMGDNGVCDLSFVDSTFEWLKVPNILIKSTVPPSTTAGLILRNLDKSICFSPEYIGEGKYYMPEYKGYPHPTDMKKHQFVILGGARINTQNWVDLFLPILGPDCQYFQTDPTTAELVKYMENSWGATKVTFSNEFFEIAKAFGSDYREVRELFLLDKRMERIHTAVFPQKRGFGGKCYPKDVNAIVKAAEAIGYEPKLLKEVLSSNEKFKGLNKTL